VLLPPVSKMTGVLFFRKPLSFAKLISTDLSNAHELTDELESTKLCGTVMPDGTVNNRDCQSMEIHPVIWKSL